MQKTIGGNACKQALAIEYYRGQRHVLEIGCSVGNISSVFRRYPDVDFTGIDIDANALVLARRRFADARNFRFTLTSLEDLAQAGDQFDYVLFAGMLHHVDDATAMRLIQAALHCMAPGGALVIYEPEAVRDGDGWFFRVFYALLEQGAYLRSRRALEDLVTRAGVALERVEDRMISPGITQRPYVARFNILLGRRADDPC